MSPLLLLALAGGCGGGGAVAPVSGRVTIGGQPLADAVVTFQPIREQDATTQEACGSVGRTDSSGRYELRLVAPDKLGAAVGKHRVSISTAIADPNDDSILPTGERVPPDWRDGSKTFVVPDGGTSQADFAIP
jgi:hypothetical protein